MKTKILKFENRQYILDRINQQGRTNISSRCVASGLKNDFVTITAWPPLPGTPRAAFTWETAKRIIESEHKTFNLR